MAEKDLISLGKLGNEEYDAEVRSKLKGSSSEKRHFAQKLRRLRENPSKSTEDIYNLISNPNASASQIQEMIKTASEMELKPFEFIQLINTAIRKHSAIFGNKIQLDANINVKSIQMEVNLNRMAERYAESQIIEQFVEKWKTEFGEKQAEEMKNALEYKYQVEKYKMAEITEEIRKVFVNAGNVHYKRQADLEPIDEEEYQEIKEEIKNGEM